MVLPDHLGPGLAVVFCGTAAGAASAERGHYYAGPGNRFWPTLAAVGLTPRRLAPDEDGLMPGLGFGLTDLNKREFGQDATLSRRHFDIDGFRARIAAAAPARVAFTSKAAARAFLGWPGGSTPSLGPQGWTVDGAAAWVLPSPSGLACRSWDIAPWRALAASVAGDRAGAATASRAMPRA